MEKIALSIPGFGKIDSSLPQGVPTGGLSTGQNAILAFLTLLVVIAILFSLWSLGKGGLDIIMSRGQKEKLKNGRERLFYGVLGLFLVFLSFFLINVASALFGTDLLCIVFKPLSSCK